MGHDLAGGVLWTVLAFGLWLALIAIIRRRRVDATAAAVAALSWIGGGLLTWLLLRVLDRILGAVHVELVTWWR